MRSIRFAFGVHVQAAYLENVVVPAARKYSLGPEYEYIRPSIKAFPKGMEQE